MLGEAPSRRNYVIDDALTIMLVDDHALFRAGLAVLIRKMPEVTDVVEYGSGQEAIQASSDNPDVDLVILDYNLQDTNGIEVLKQVKTQAPELPVILLSASQDAALIQLALREHASGFIVKTATPDVMLSAVQLVLNGGIYVPPEAISKVPETSSYSDARLGSTADNKNRGVLTQRQMDVLLYMKQGLSNKEIARELTMSPSTVKVHVAAILKELSACSRTQAVFIAKDSGLID